MGTVVGWWRWAVALTVLGSIAACSHGVYHRVKPGENLYRISKAYGVPLSRLAAINHLADPARIEVGQRIYIPDARHPVPVDVITPRSANMCPPQTDAAHSGAPAFIWPVDGGAITSGFGKRGRSFHDGIDIAAPKGTPVHAAHDGEVTYSDALRGYGNVIIVRHSHGFATVYAHNERNHAHEGQHVHRGQVIGSVGDTGHTSGANLHFEVRQDNVACNPLYFLPSTTQTAAALGGR